MTATLPSSTTSIPFKMPSDTVFLSASPIAKKSFIFSCPKEDIDIALSDLKDKQTAALVFKHVWEELKNTDPEITTLPKNMIDFTHDIILFHVCRHILFNAPIPYIPNAK